MDFEENPGFRALERPGSAQNRQETSGNTVGRCLVMVVVCLNVVCGSRDLTHAPLALKSRDLDQMVQFEGIDSIGSQ